MITPKAKTAIHVKTQEEYDSLMKELEDSGFEIGGTLPTDWGVWKECPPYEQGVCINIEIKDWLGYSEINFYQKQGYTIEEYRPEFRVGDTVEVIFSFRNPELIGKQVVIERADDKFIYIKESWYQKSIEYCSHCLKLISRAETKTVIEDHKYGLHCYATSITYNKPNKKTFMSNIVEFAKNQALKATNPDEFALRTAGLKDQEGNWTEDARVIVFNFKAVQLGFANGADLIDRIGEAGKVSPFEYHALFIEFAADLLNIANEKVKADKK